MEAPRCQHKKLDGKMCGGNAMRSGKYCYYHDRYYDVTSLPTGNTKYDPPVFEDSRSIVLAIYQTLKSYLSGNLEPRACGLALYGYQVAASMITRPDARSPEDEEAFLATLQKSNKKAEPEQKPEQEFSLAKLIFDTLAAYDRGEWSTGDEEPKQLGS
jgi:hypothetical protein